MAALLPMTWTLPAEPGLSAAVAAAAAVAGPSRQQPTAMKSLAATSRADYKPPPTAWQQDICSRPGTNTTVRGRVVAVSWQV